MAYTLGDKAAKQIAEVIRDYNGQSGAPNGPTYNRGRFRDEYTVFGKLDGTLARNGTATLSIYKPGTAGGIGTDTTQNVTIIDIGMIPSSASPLAANKVVMAHYSRGAWVIGAYEC
ncbi:hypothetical protein EBZ39_03720 [bacterium]|nr:hypothetical protein [bacterium]